MNSDTSPLGPVTIGMLGTGAFAARMAGAIATSPDVELAGVFSNDPTRAEGFAAEHGGRAYGDLTEMAASVDALYVCGATGKHASDSIAVLRTGRPVLCEKPMAIAADQTAEVLSVAAETGTLFVEAFWTCHLPAWQALKARLAAGALGQARSLFADFGHATGPADNPRVWSRDDGVLRDRAVYPVCFALWNFGPATLREADVTRTNGVDSEAILILDHENGAVSTLKSSLLAETRNCAVIEGTRNALSLPPPFLGAQHVRNGALRTEGHGPRLKIVRKAAQAFRHAGAEFHPYGLDKYHPQFAHFAELIRAGAKESPIVPHWLSRDVTVIIEQARAG